MTRWNAWTIFTVSFRRHVSYESLGPCSSGRASSVPHLYEKEGQNFCFWHFILESVLSEEEKNSNVESRQKRWGWNLEAIHPGEGSGSRRQWDRLTRPNYTWKMYTSFLSTAWKNRCSDGACGLWQLNQTYILGLRYLTPCLLQCDFFFQGSEYSSHPSKHF